VLSYRPAFVHVYLIGSDEPRGEFSFSGPYYTILNWGPFWKAEVALVTFSDSESASVPNFESGSGSEKFQNLRIRLLFRLWLPWMQPKFSSVFT